MRLDNSNQEVISYYDLTFNPEDPGAAPPIDLCRSCWENIWGGREDVLCDHPPYEEVGPYECYECEAGLGENDNNDYQRDEYPYTVGEANVCTPHLETYPVGNTDIICPACSEPFDEIQFHNGVPCRAHCVGTVVDSWYDWRDGERWVYSPRQWRDNGPNCPNCGADIKPPTDEEFKELVEMVKAEGDHPDDPEFDEIARHLSEDVAAMFEAKPQPGSAEFEALVAEHTRNMFGDERDDATRCYDDCHGDCDNCTENGGQLDPHAYDAEIERDPCDECTVTSELYCQLCEERIIGKGYSPDVCPQCGHARHDGKLCNVVVDIVEGEGTKVCACDYGIPDEGIDAEIPDTIKALALFAPSTGGDKVREMLHDSCQTTHPDDCENCQDEHPAVAEGYEDDKAERHGAVWALGYTAAKDGKARDANPYPLYGFSVVPRNEWFRGYDAAGPDDKPDALGITMGDCKACSYYLRTAGETGPKRCFAKAEQQVMCMQARAAEELGQRSGANGGSQKDNPYQTSDWHFAYWLSGYARGRQQANKPQENLPAIKFAGPPRTPEYVPDENGDLHYNVQPSEDELGNPDGTPDMSDMPGYPGPRGPEPTLHTDGQDVTLCWKCQIDKPIPGTNGLCKRCYFERYGKYPQTGKPQEDIHERVNADQVQREEIQYSGPDQETLRAMFTRMTSETLAHIRKDLGTWADGISADIQLALVHYVNYQPAKAKERYSIKLRELDQQDEIDADTREYDRGHIIGIAGTDWEEWMGDKSTNWQRGQREGYNEYQRKQGHRPTYDPDSSMLQMMSSETLAEMYYDAEQDGDEDAEGLMDAIGKHFETFRDSQDQWVFDECLKRRRRMGRE